MCVLRIVLMHMRIQHCVRAYGNLNEPEEKEEFHFNKFLISLIISIYFSLLQKKDDNIMTSNS